MRRINPQLFERLLAKLKVGDKRLYGLISQKANETHLPRHLAAIVLATERGVSVGRYATDDELAEIRQAVRGGGVSAPASELNQRQAERPVATRKGSPRVRASTKKPEPRRANTVFVVHGRDSKAREAIFTFLRAVGLRPLEWSQAVALTGKGSPYVGEILDAAFREAAAIVILMTPDDDARLRPEFLNSRDGKSERELTGQARPNVLFEAGMAFGRNADSTVLVQIGDLRPFSDVGGRHAVHLSNTFASRQDFLTKLSNAGCSVDLTGSDWNTAGDFSPRPLRSSMPPRGTSKSRR